VQYRHIPTQIDRWMLRLLEKFSTFRSPKCPLFASYLYYIVYALQVALDLRRQKCDIVHINNFSQFVPIIRAFNPGSKVALHMQCEWLTQLDQAMVKRRLKKVDLVVGDSEYITQQVRNGFPEFGDRCCVLYNGVDNELFCPGNGQSGVKRNRGKRLLFVGRVSPEKGVHVLLDAFRKVDERFPDAHLDIVGSKGQLPYEYLVALTEDKKVSELASFYMQRSNLNYFRELQSKLISLNLNNRVTFWGSIAHSDTIEFYRQADVFIFPSVWNEPFGIPIIEAMACGVAVVSTRSGGITEIVEDGKTGVLVGRGHVDGLAEAVVGLLEKEELRASMGSQGRRRAKELFSWDRIAETLCTYYREICPSQDLRQ